MTSMPASRSAAATTFAPRSWPSRPGLATRTRIGRIDSSESMEPLSATAITAGSAAGKASQRRMRRSNGARRCLFLAARRGASHSSTGVSGRSVEAVVRRSTTSPCRRKSSARRVADTGECDARVPVRAPARATSSSRQYAGQGVERAFLRRSGCRSPAATIAREKATHDAVTIPAVPDQHAAGLEHARELGTRRVIVTRKEKNPNDVKRLTHRIEAAGPSRGQRRMSPRV